MMPEIYDIVAERAVLDSCLLSSMAMAEMRDKGMYEPLDGQSFLVQLTVNISSTTQLLYYAEIVKDKAGHLRMADVGCAIIDLANEQRKDVSEIIDKAEKVIFQASQGKEVSALGALKDLVPQALDKILTVQASGGRPITGYSTGFVDLDRILAGFQPG